VPGPTRVRSSFSSLLSMALTLLVSFTGLVVGAR